MHYYNKETHVELLTDHPNIIRENKVYVLPVVMQNFAEVEIYLTERQTVIIESPHHPIRYGRHCGSRIHLGAAYDKVDYNPKLIWNGKEWFVQTHGTLLFAEIELNSNYETEKRLEKLEERQ
jgi:hypothetical protein